MKIFSSPKIGKDFLNVINDLGTKENYIVVPFCEKAYPLREHVIVCDLPYLPQHVIEPISRGEKATERKG